MSLTEKQKKELALRRIRRDMPEEFASSGLVILRSIPNDQPHFGKHNGVTIFRHFATKSPKQKRELVSSLLRTYHDAGTTINRNPARLHQSNHVTDACRYRIAKRLSKELGSNDQIAKLQPGQWASAGKDDSPLARGRFYGIRSTGTVVVAWQGNAHGRGKGGYCKYQRTIQQYTNK